MVNYRIVLIYLEMTKISINISKICNKATKLYSKKIMSFVLSFKF